MRLPRLIVSGGGGRRGTHLAPHASGRGRYERGGLRTDPGRVHGRHLMVSTDAAVMVGQRGPAGRALHGHQLGRRYGDQTVAAVRTCRETQRKRN